MGRCSKRAISLFGRFSTHLDAHEKGSIDRKRFFPEDGTATGIGRSAPRVAVLSRSGAPATGCWPALVKPGGWSAISPRYMCSIMSARGSGKPGRAKTNPCT